MNGKQKAAMIGGAAVSLLGAVGGATLGAGVANVGITGGAMVGGQVAGQLSGFINSLAPNEQISSSQSSSTTTTTENKAVIDLLQLLDEALKKTNEYDSYGMWHVAGYFISDDMPAAAVSFAVESYDSISEFAQGEISGGELAYDLGENATAIAGGIKGAAVGASIGTKVGAVVGTVAGPAGTAVGAAVGGVTGSIVGGVVGCVVASEVYATAVEFGAEHAEQIAEKAQEFADSTIETVKEAVPEQLDNVKSAFNDFASAINLPIHV